MPRSVATLFLLLIGVVALGRPQASVVGQASGHSPLWHLAMEEVLGGFQAPVAVRHAGDERLFVVERTGVIRVVDAGGQVRPLPFLDIRARVGDLSGERGLVGLAFHPDYAANGAFFLLYTASNGDSRIDRFRVSADPNIADPTSRLNVLTIHQPSAFHNGGDVVFGPDNYLYVGLGDGGPIPGDPLNNGQDGSNLLGTLLRLDVDNGTPYSVPSDNPFVGDSQVRDEIWAFGLRNPWRFSFDRLTGDLYVGDVGEWTWEEINVVPAGDVGGQNYGWRCYEGLAPFLPEACEGTAVTFPDFVYSHRHGCAVVGGHVYRGDAYPTLAGHYFMADYCTGRVVGYDPTGERWRRRSVGYIDDEVVALGEDAAGELLVVGQGKGRIYRFQPEAFGDHAYLPFIGR